jgi:integrase
MVPLCPENGAGESRMAWLEQHPKSGIYRITLRYGGQKINRTLKTSDSKEAEAVLHRVEENVRLLERGRLTLPEDADLATFLLSDGKLQQKPIVVASLTLTELFSQYKSSMPQGALETNSLYTVGIHLKHLQRLMGAKFSVRQLTLTDLQSYVERRSREAGRRKKPVSPVTMKKELATFSGVWTWALASGLVKGAFPNRALKYPKTTEKAPFQTYVQIEEQIKQSKMPAAEQEELWDCLFLTLEETGRVLEHVRLRSEYPYLHPMLVLASHSGARRSELIRSRISDIDFRSHTMTIREKKRVKGQRSTRRVPLSNLNERIIGEWIKQHPGGPFTFCQLAGAELKVNDVHHHLKAALGNSEWDKLRGWHVFRHSFASNCAAKGIDQRLIDGWMGHQTEEMRKRYRHLFPDQQTQAINAVFA